MTVLENVFLGALFGGSGSKSKKEAERETMKLLEEGKGVPWDLLLIGTLVSAVTAYLCIHLFLKLLERIGMFPFVLYRFFLGAVLFYLIYYVPGFFAHA